MDPRSLRVLEYPQILELLAGETITPMGREQAAGLMPATDVETSAHRPSTGTGSRRIPKYMGPSTRA